jgi:hypothetical protein
MQAPVDTVLRHKLRLIAKWQAEQEANEEDQKK